MVGLVLAAPLASAAVHISRDLAIARAAVLSSGSEGADRQAAAASLP
jgi:hypothetical protein